MTLSAPNPRAFSLLGRFPHALLAVLAIVSMAAAPSWASTGRVLILHTNDIHDHLRPGYIGIGGMPYVSGFVNAVRAQRDDVIVLDAGDALEKGDLLAYLTHGLATYQAMARVGYDAVTIGNHDLDFGIEHLRLMDEVLGQRLVLLNLLDRYGEPAFRPSRIVEVNGVRVGVIGMIAPRRAHFGGVDREVSGRMLAAEAERLKQEVHVVVALSHEGSRNLREWARMAPAVDVFIAGHHHETLLEPVIAEGSGAIIVAAGSDAHWIGHLELEVDLERREVVSHSGGLNLLRHDRVAVDEEMRAWLASLEAEIAPGASETVIELEAPMGWFALGRLKAEAIRWHADADIGLYHPTQIIRNGLPAGEIDLNAIFRVSSERADTLVRLRMTGAEVSAYMTGLAMSDWGQTQWAGMQVSVRETGDGRTVDGTRVGRALYDNNLDPDRHYTVVMPEREWERYLVEILDPAYVRRRPAEAGDYDAPLTGQRRTFPSEGLDFAAYEALHAYLEELARSGILVEARLQELTAAQGDADPNEARFESRFLAPLQRDRFLELEQRTTSLRLGSPSENTAN